MRKNSLILIVLFLLSLAPVVSAQVYVKRSSDIIELGNKKFYKHIVKEGESLKAIAAAYSSSEREIIQCNPELIDGARVGMVISIPINNNTTSQTVVVKAVETKRPQSHVVLQGETLSSIARKYGINVADLASMNPGSQDGLRVGQSLMLPAVIEESKTNTQANKSTQQISVKHTEATRPKTEVQKEEPKDRVHKVKQGENLYTIAKTYGIDIADFKRENLGLSNYPKVGLEIKVPDIVNNESYIVHVVESGQKTSSLIKSWAVDTKKFKDINPSVGKRVFKNQKVLIPIDRVVVVVTPPTTEPVVVEEPEQPVSPVEPCVECKRSSENARKSYRVALMIPLYLDVIDPSFVAAQPTSQLKATKPFSFLQYYEGFLLAAEQMCGEEGLKLDLMVFDVNENPQTAQSALNKIRGNDVDLIVGPFFSKSFELVQQYASEKDIMIVNPLSTRESIIDGSPNVVKVKPNVNAQVEQLIALVEGRFSDSKVFVLSMNSYSDKSLIDSLENGLRKAIKPYVKVAYSDFMPYARAESRRNKLGKKLPSTIEVERKVFSTDVLTKTPYDSAGFYNNVLRYSYNDANIKAMRSELSAVRNNLVIAYGNDVVFATEVVNNINKMAETYPITLVALPDWSGFDNLFVNNLIQMNAVYFDDFFVDYSDVRVETFILDFAEKYGMEPQAYAFEGYDLARFLFSALMQYGSHSAHCLPYVQTDSMHSQYIFERRGAENGVENVYWNIYQYKNLEYVPFDSSIYMK